jgi:hypothetical protein
MKTVAFLTIILVATLQITIANAQRKIAGTYPQKQSLEKKFSNEKLPPGCDIINYPVPNTWSAVTYVFDDGSFVSGTNSFQDRQKANFFDLSSTSFQFFQGAKLLFSFANTANLDNFSKKIYLKIYAWNNLTQGPGKELACRAVKFTRVRSDVLESRYTNVFFETPVKLPPSKKFFVSIDFSNLTWPVDSLSLYSTQIGEVIPGTAWEQWVDNTWHSFYEAYGNIDLTLYIFPLVSTTNKCCIQQHQLSQVESSNAISKKTGTVTRVTFANPFSGALKLELNLSTAQPVSLFIYDMQGKLVASEKQKMYNVGYNTIIMSSAANLQKGMYMLKLNAATEQLVYKVVKQ